MGRAGSHHRIYAVVDNQQVEHQFAMVETSAMINKVKVKICLTLVLQIVSFHQLH